MKQISTRISTSRRAFLKTAATSTLLLSSASALSQGDRPDNIGMLTANSEPNVETQLLNSIEDSIRANFGSGFGVLSFSQEQGDTNSHKPGDIYAQIEHLENYYTVVSTDLSDWKILQSSVS